jgi:hypothetical protein
MRGTRQWATKQTTIVAACYYYWFFFLVTVVVVVVVSAAAGPPPPALLGRGAASALLQRGAAAADDHPHYHRHAAAITTLWTRQTSSSSSSSFSAPAAAAAANDNVVDGRSNAAAEVVNHHDKTAAAAAAALVDEAKRQLLCFLKSGSSSSRQDEGEFHINGWRWHTMSLIREASRLSKTAQKLLLLVSSQASVGKDEQDYWTDDLLTAANYVVNFNMRGLHKIETTLFFPWARQRIVSQLMTTESAATTAATATRRQEPSLQDVATAFGTIMHHLESQRATVEQLGVQLVCTRMYDVYVVQYPSHFPTADSHTPPVFSFAQNGLLSSSSSFSKKNSNKNVEEGSLRHDNDDVPSRRLLLLDRVGVTSRAIVQHTQSMLDLEESLLVPMVARLVPAAEQKSFNTKVIVNLGVLDSRLHLVGMHQAVVSSCNKKKNDKEQLRLFEQVIPSFPRGMIPRWKRLLYDPQVAIFQRILLGDDE